MSPQQSKKLYNAGLKVVKLLAKDGKMAFFVGGYVRNNLLKLPSDNIDIATDATPDEIEKILSGQDITVKPVGKKFGSILAIVDSFSVEVTTFRKEGRYSDNRHPDKVEFIKEYLADAKRRDFTINALYFDPIKKELFDPTNGLKDLKGKLLKFVGDPKKRIDEDALRMLRGVRLATQIGFKLEKNSFAAIKTRAKYIQDISGERVKAELDKILLSENRVEGLRLLDKASLLKFICPELDALKKIFHKSKIYHLEGSIFEHTMLCLGSLKKETNLDLIYATIFHDTGKGLTGTPREKEEGIVISFPNHPAVSAVIFKKFALKLRFSLQSAHMIDWLIESHDDWRKLITGDERQGVLLVLDPRFELLQKIWFADMSGNIRTDNDKSNQRIGYALSVKYQKMIEGKHKLIGKLAKGDLMMKHSNLKPGKVLGEKIDDVKVQIVLGKIKNETDLKAYLQD